MPEKKRTTFLTVWLVLLLIGSCIGIIANIFVLVAGTSLIAGIIPLWAVWVSLVLAAIDIVFITLMFKYKKIGLYGYLAIWLISTIVTLSYAGFTGSGIFGVVISIVWTGILLLAIRPNWKNFE